MVLSTVFCCFTDDLADTIAFENFEPEQIGCVTNDEAKLYLQDLEYLLNLVESEIMRHIILFMASTTRVAE